MNIVVLFTQEIKKLVTCSVLYVKICLKWSLKMKSKTTGTVIWFPHKLIVKFFTFVQM